MVLYWAVMISFIFSLIYVPLRAILDDAYRENTEYKIMIFQTLFGLIIVNLPSFLTKRFMWKIPKAFAVPRRMNPPLVEQVFGPQCRESALRFLALIRQPFGLPPAPKGKAYEERPWSDDHGLLI